MATHSNRLSVRQVWRQLGLGSYKSAWLLCAKLRRPMVNRKRGLPSGLVEVDETQIAYRTMVDPQAGGAMLKTNGWSGYSCASGLIHEPHVVGNIAAQIILPWVHRIFSKRKTWALDAAIPKNGRLSFA